MTARFVTEDGVEVPAVTAAQMREIDRGAIEETGPTLLQMMEHAGRSLARESLDRLGESWRRARIVVLAGPGGNGGGGICAARHLANRGVDVRLCLAAPDRLGDAAIFQREIYAQAGGQEVARGALDGARPTLIIDALLGYSLRGAPRPDMAALIRWAASSGIPVLALDVPSGVDATTGETPGDAVTATWTLTLALPKTGLRAAYTGDLVLADLGIPAAAFRRIGIPYTSPFGTRFRVPLRLE
ncbi:MAG: NAD(P)H-hydrate epimerase [Armatimonadetes bacterium]|nr:NAD(P)H-hydrate epimerase [Armatimonadota bacterium]